MTFRSASQSHATQRQAKRISDEGVKPAPWAVVAFRRGRNNKGQTCVFRRCWPFRDWSKARVKFHAEVAAQGTDPRTNRWALILFVTAAALDNIEAVGDRVALLTWMAQRKGVNRDADPYLSGTYMHRELRGEVTFAVEGADLRHLSMGSALARAAGEDEEQRDCGDNSCRYAKKKGGMRTNGGCRCDDCPECGAAIRPPRGHREWCSNCAAGKEQGNG